MDRKILYDAFEKISQLQEKIIIIASFSWLEFSCLMLGCYFVFKH